MELQTWLVYLLAILVLTASPGPSVLLCMTKSVTSGFRPSVYAALGSLSAIYIILTLSFTGLGLVIAQSEIAFNLIKWTGAAYLIYLGFKALSSKQRSYSENDFDSDGDTQQALSRPSAFSHYLSGFIVGASNPKAIVFFTALFPQFINPEASLIAQYLILAATFVVLEFAWLMFYAYLGKRSSVWLMQEGRARMFNRITGGVFVSAGVLLSTSSRASS